METKLTVKFKRGGRRPRSHGGYSFLTRGELPENRTHVLKYLMAAREGLIRDLGPSEENLSTAQIILIDRITSMLGIVRLMEEYIRERSVMVGAELAPCLKASYLAYNNSIRLDLVSLGLDRKDQELLFTPYELTQRIEAEAEEDTPK